jgi:hypothetical protein
MNRTRGLGALAELGQRVGSGIDGVPLGQAVGLAGGGHQLAKTASLFSKYQ